MCGKKKHQLTLSNPCLPSSLLRFNSSMISSQLNTNLHKHTQSLQSLQTPQTPSPQSQISTSQPSAVLITMHTAGANDDVREGLAKRRNSEVETRKSTTRFNWRRQWSKYRGRKIFSKWVSLCVAGPDEGCGQNQGGLPGLLGKSTAVFPQGPPASQAWGRDGTTKSSSFLGCSTVLRTQKMVSCERVSSLTAHFSYVTFSSFYKS